MNNSCQNLLMIDFSALGTILNISWLDISLASLTVFIGFIIGHFAGKFFGKLIRNLELSHITERLGLAKKPEWLVEKGVSLLIYIIAIVTAITQLKLIPFVWTILVILIIILAIILGALAVKEFLPNLIIGFYLRSVEHLNPGDKTNLLGTRGKIKHVGVLETKIITKDKNILLVPNSFFAKRINLQFTTNLRKKK